MPPSTAQQSGMQLRAASTWHSTGGQASEPNSTLAALLSLKRRGCMVLMGSMSVSLPYGEMLRNGWELVGHFMYSSADYRALGQWFAPDSFRWTRSA